MFHLCRSFLVFRLEPVLFLHLDTSFKELQSDVKAKSPAAEHIVKICSKSI